MRKGQSKGPACTKVVVRQINVSAYLAKDRRWVESVEHAMEFPTPAQAVLHCQSRLTEPFEVVVRGVLNDQDLVLYRSSDVKNCEAA